MSFFRLIIFFIIAYLISKIFRSFFQPGKQNTTVGGAPENDPLDLSNADIEDVDFEELDNKKQ